MSDPWGDPDPDRTWRPDVEVPPVLAAPRPGDGTDDWSYYPPPDLDPRAWEPPAPVPIRERAMPVAVTFAVTAAVTVLLGAPLALVWRAVAKPAVVLRTAAGPQVAALESDQVFAVDGWFVVVSIVVGVLAGTVAWLVLRDRGPAGPIALAAGGLAAAAVAVAVGRRLVVDRYLYDFCLDPRAGCTIYDGTLRLNAGPAPLVVLPAAMLAAFAVLALAFDRHRDGG